MESFCIRRVDLHQELGDARLNPHPEHSAVDHLSVPGQTPTLQKGHTFKLNAPAWRLSMQVPQPF